MATFTAVSASILTSLASEPDFEMASFERMLTRNARVNALMKIRLARTRRRAAPLSGPRFPVIRFWCFICEFMGVSHGGHGEDEGGR